MKYFQLSVCVFGLVLLATTSMTSCGKRKASQIPPLDIEVVHATEQQLPTTLNFVGKTHSLYDIKIQPRISGYLISINYREGMPVQKGQLLVQLERRPAMLEVNKAQAQEASAKAQEVEAQNNYDRSVPLARINAISKSSLDQATATLAAAKAAVKSAQSTLASAELDLSYTKIYASTDGVIGTTQAQIGDYVGIGTQYQVLNTLSNIDSIYIYLSIPTPRYLEMVERDASGQPLFDDKKLLSDIQLIFSDGTTYKHKGIYKFTQRAVNSSTGSVVLNVLFPNPEQALKPGEFVRVAANVGQDRKQVVIPQKAVMQSQGVNSVFVLGKNNTVEYREIIIGQTIGPLWRVTRGLQNGEIVLTEGLQKLRSGMKINPIHATTPSLK